VNIDDMEHTVFVIKRPGCDEFMRRLAEHYELLIYTDIWRVYGSYVSSDDDDDDDDDNDDDDSD
jgi:hypothetical protein